MIVGLQHPGSGLGDQLFCYIASRIKAEELETDFTMVGQFKGESFIKFKRDDEKIGSYVIPHIVEQNTGKIMIQSDFPLFETTRKYYDPEWNFIKDNTIVDGCTLQDERYFDIEKVREWLVTEPISMPDDLCIINFRGGEFSLIPDLMLPPEYYREAVEIMAKKHPGIRFEVHTDDELLASHFFPDFDIICGIEKNWKAVRYAKHLILSNSAFGIIPALLSPAQEIIAPRKWARRNLNDEWSLPGNYYKRFTYI